VKSSQVLNTSLLLEAGANPNMMNYGDYTPLHISNCNKCTALLLSNGADIVARQWDVGRPPLLPTIDFFMKVVIIMIVLEIAR
jgi:ankyrin repeat protein